MLLTSQCILGCDIKWLHQSLLRYFDSAMLQKMSSVQPFQFEPEHEISEDENIEDIQHQINQNEDDRRVYEARVGQNGWCLCGYCLPMLTEKESVCCKELQFFAVTVQGKFMDSTLVV